MQADDSISREIIALERQYWNAIRNKDAATAVSLSDDPCVVVGPQGVGEIDRQTLAGMLGTAAYELKDFRFDDMHIRRVADDVVLVAYKVREDLVVEGEDLNLDAYETSIWVRLDGRWT